MGWILVLDSQAGRNSKADKLYIQNIEVDGAHNKLVSPENLMRVIMVSTHAVNIIKISSSRSLVSQNIFPLSENLSAGSELLSKSISIENSKILRAKAPDL